MWGWGGRWGIIMFIIILVTPIIIFINIIISIAILLLPTTLTDGAPVNIDVHLKISPKIAVALVGLQCVKTI